MSDAAGLSVVGPALNASSLREMSLRVSPYSQDGALVNTSYLHVEGADSVRQAVLVSYLATCIVGITGNSLVIYIIAHYSQVRNKSVANYYIWNLAFADLFFVLAMPFFCYSTFTLHWPFGSAMCKVGFAIRETNKYASIFTLTALSVDRYLASFYNLGYLRTMRVGVGVCGAVWVLCGLISTPYWQYAAAIPTHRNNLTGDMHYSCRILWPASHLHTYLEFWAYFELMIGLVVPFCFILTAYILLARRLRLILRSSSASSSTSASQPSIQRPSRRMTRTVAVVVVTFLVCQAPYHFVQFFSLHKYQQFHSAGGATNATVAKAMQEEVSDAEKKAFVVLNAVAQILVFVSSCCNPIIYGLLNENYLKLYSVVLCKCTRTFRPPSGEEAESGELEESNMHTSNTRITYRFQISFHPPCGRKLDAYRHHPGRHETEQIELEDKTNDKVNHSVT